MTQSQYLIKRKLNILELGATLGSISEACRKLGMSHRHYYDIKSAIEKGPGGTPRKVPQIIYQITNQSARGYDSLSAERSGRDFHRRTLA